MNTQEFLEAVRHYIVLHCAPPEWSKMLTDVTIEVSDHYTDIRDKVRCHFLGQVTGGDESTYANGCSRVRIYPFAFTTKEHMAMTFVHELAHVVTPEWADAHGLIWAYNCAMLGLEEKPYDGVPTEHPWKWLDPELAAFVKALPFELAAKATP